MRLLAERLVQVGAIVLVTMAGNPRSLESQKLLADGVQDLATQIAAKVQQEQKQKIAVLPFRELDGGATLLGDYMAEDLTTHLFNLGNFDIVERTMLDRLLGEIKLGQSGLIDPETAKEVGKIAGVDAIVSGTLTDLQSYVAVNCRLIDAQTGRVFAAAQVRIAVDDDVRKIRQAPAPSAKTAGPSGGASGAETQERSEAARTLEQEEQGFRFSLRGCSRSGSAVRCELLVTNEWQDRSLVLVSSRLFDDHGNEWDSGKLTPSRSTRSIQVGGYQTSRVVSGVPIRFELRFDGVPSQAKIATLVEVSFRSDREGRVQFRAVPLSGL
ncbi:MAG TPA: FlgO family outer membrane protein [Thermoanaerobaculia bacterium]|nr:FlgO family outer membrane protein [Thermoanaerobaculia bacterium]